jgi:hypothetical protein
VTKHYLVKRRRKRKCLNCNEDYYADYRNLRHQRYCSKPDCRKASKRASQQRYLASEKGRDYFTGPENVTRVRQWREVHPGYWKRKAIVSHHTLQDDCSLQPDKNQSDMGKLHNNALQDVCFTQPALLIGVIASLTGNALQDDIVTSLRRFIDLGNDILGFVPNTVPTLLKGDRRNDGKAHNLSATTASRSETIQLGGPTSGPS